MRANIQAVSLKIQTLRSQNAMAQAMKGVTKAMQSMNKQVILLPQIFNELTHEWMHNYSYEIDALVSRMF